MLSPLHYAQLHQQPLLIRSSSPKMLASGEVRPTANCSTANQEKLLLAPAVLEKMMTVTQVGTSQVKAQARSKQLLSSTDQWHQLLCCRLPGYIFYDCQDFKGEHGQELSCPELMHRPNALLEGSCGSGMWHDCPGKATHIVSLLGYFTPSASISDSFTHRLTAVTEGTLRTGMSSLLAPATGPMATTARR